jgi:hypothetical protein
LAEYHQRMELHKKQMEQDEQRKLNELKIALEEQSVRDRERIDFRNKQFYEKKIEQVKSKLEKLNEMEKKEERLQKFYESVRPKIERDPARIVSFTEAELNRRGIVPQGKEQYAERKDLFNNNFSFNDKYLNGDARLRIEERLRQAGLINKEYARTIIDNIKQNNVMNVQAKRNANANSEWNGFAFKT